MAADPSYSTPARNAKADALCDLLDTGYLRVYAGTRPATADDVVGGATLLAELRFSATAFGAAVAGVATANAITDDATADATGTAAWFRTLKSDGTTAVFDGNVATADADLILNSVAIQVGARVVGTSLTYTEPEGP